MFVPLNFLLLVLFLIKKKLFTTRTSRSPSFQAAIAGAAAWWFFIREGEGDQIPDVSARFKNPDVSHLVVYDKVLNISRQICLFDIDTFIYYQQSLCS